MMTLNPPGSPASLFIRAREIAAHTRFDPKDVEELSADFHAAQTGRSVLTRERKRAVAEDGDVCQRAVLFAEIEEVGIGERIQLGNGSRPGGYRSCRR